MMSVRRFRFPQAGQRRLAGLLVCLLFFLGTSVALAEVSYSVQGAPFATAMPPYSTSDSVSGSFSLPIPLAPNLPLTDISNLVGDFSFQDGVQLRLPNNTTTCRFEVATDSLGAVSDWRIFLRQAPTPAVGDPQQFLDSERAGGDQVGSGAAAGSACATLSNAVLASTPIQATWTEPSLGAPAPYLYTGLPFTTASPPYSTSDRLTGTLELTALLPPFVSVPDLAPFIVDFFFEDGVQTRTPANSEVCVSRVGTDSSGNFFAWSVTLRQAPVPAPSNPQQSLDTTETGDLVGSVPAGVDVCKSLPLTLEASNTTPGSWSIGGSPVSPTDYHYLGAPFTMVVAPYAVGGRVRGSIQVPGSLPPNLPLSEIGFALINYTFQDGFQVRTPSDSVVCRFEVATNAQGEIIEWNVLVREIVANSGDNQGSIFSAAPLQTIFDQAGQGIEVGDLCGNNLSLDQSGESTSPGTWSRRRGAGVIAIPTLSPLALVGLAVLLVLCAGGVLRRRSRV